MKSAEWLMTLGRGVVAVCMTACACNVHAFAWHYCNDTPAIWEGSRASTYQIMGCSIPAGSSRATDVIYGFDQWNDIRGMWDVFEHAFGRTSCDPVTQGNDVNEVFFAPGSAIDGAAGVTFVRYDSCFWAWDTQHIIETDVAFNGDAGALTEPGSPPCNTYAPPSRRTTIVHEFGHALGLEHYDDAMNMMMTSDSEGKFCGNFVVEPLGDDAAGGRFLYNSGNSSTDIGASEQRLVGPNDVDLNTTPGVQSLCPGDRYTFRWSVGNVGTTGVRYDVAWFLSTNNVISTSDILVGSNSGAFISANHFNTWPRTVTIPSTVSFGTEYFLGTIVDHNDAVAERFETNNRTFMARKIRIRNRGECG